MKNILIKHIEKIVLLIVVAGLIGWSVLAKRQIVEPTDEFTEKNQPSQVVAHGNVIPEEINTLSLTEPVLVTETWTASSSRAFAPQGRVYECQDSTCRSAIPYHLDICPISGTNQTTRIQARAISAESDKDRDGMPADFEEKYYFLSDDNPLDANLDYDGDGFSNLMEYLHDTDPSDPDSKPLHAVNLYYSEGSVRPRPLPFIFADLKTNPSENKESWMIFMRVQTTNNRPPQDVLLKVGQTFLNGRFKIVDAEHVVVSEFDPSVNAVMQVDRSKVTVATADDSVSFELPLRARVMDTRTAVGLVYDPRITGIAPVSIGTHSGAKIKLPPKFESENVEEYEIQVDINAETRTITVKALPLFGDELEPIELTRYISEQERQRTRPQSSPQAPPEYFAPDGMGGFDPDNPSFDPDNPSW